MYDYKKINEILAVLYRIKESNGRPDVINEEWERIKGTPEVLFIIVNVALNVFYSNDRTEKKKGAIWVASLISNVFKIDMHDEEFSKGIRKAIDVKNRNDKEKLEIFQKSLLNAIRANISNQADMFETREFYGMVARELVYSIEDTAYSKMIKKWFSKLIAQLINNSVYPAHDLIPFIILEDVHASLISTRVVKLLIKKCGSPQPEISEGAKNSLAHLIVNSPDKREIIVLLIKKVLEDMGFEEDKKIKVKNDVVGRVNKIKRRISG